MTEFEVRGKTVIFRPDINSPIDPATKRIVNTNRIEKTVPTLNWLLERGAKVALIAHQGDTLDYQNLIPLAEHAQKLSDLARRKVGYVDDVCGPAAIAAVKALAPGEAVILGNLRYLAEEISTFETAVKLKAPEMLDTWLVRSLAPVADLYVNDAFAAAHRNAPSMVAFQELLPTAGGIQLMEEYTALKTVLDNPKRPCVYVLGGAKISDAFDMMRKVLEEGTADQILAAGVTGLVMHLARGVELGQPTRKFLKDKGLEEFVPEARKLLDAWGPKYLLPVDLAYDSGGARAEVDVPAPGAAIAADKLFPDVGAKTVALFKRSIASAGSIFVNGPAGMYEDERWAYGTREIWTAISKAPGYTVVGGGDTISAATKFTDLSDYGYVCTGGGAMVRFLAGKRLPLIEAMERAFDRNLREPLRRA
ncbi:MAG TPA: phosphoglycerate kinase [Spirochaetia bacterium]|nr:phosphoglycerate kinase [Spirochaetia bacterium]HRZ63706.1 phosphoglycerate kinase [Spirochaetia bacterium]